MSSNKYYKNVETYTSANNVNKITYTQIKNVENKNFIYMFKKRFDKFKNIINKKFKKN